MAFASHTAPLPGQPSPQPPKRPRVSFDTVSTRVFDPNPKGRQDLGSPYEQVLSPLPGSACSGGLDTSRADITEELTGRIPGLSTLVDEDEQYHGWPRPAAQKTKLGQEPVAARASQELLPEPVTAQATEENLYHTVQTPTTEPQSSPLHDFYEEFKKQSKSKETLETSKAEPETAPAAFRPFIVQSPPPSASRGRSPDTVNIDAFVKTIENGPSAQPTEAESDIPEGRKSWGTCLPGSSLEASSLDDVPKIPTPLRMKRQGPYTSAARTQGPALPSCPPQGPGTYAGATASSRSPPAAREPYGSTDIMDFHRSFAPKESTLQAEHQNVAIGPRSSPPPRKGGQSHAVSFQPEPRPLVTAPQSPPLARRERQMYGLPSQERGRLSTRTSSSGRELDSLLYSPTESALPGSSAFQLMSDTALGQDDKMQNAAIAPMAWDDFLGHIGVFPSLDAQPSEGSIDADMAPAAAPSVTEGCSDVLERRRVQLLQQTVKALANRNEDMRKQYIHSVASWNGARQIAPAAVELLKILESPESAQELESLRSKSKSWQTCCKRDAWLKWYNVKHAWLLKDLDQAREANAKIKSEIASMAQASQRLNETSKTARSMIKHQQDRQELQSNADRHRQVAEERMQNVEEDQQLMLRKSRDTREELETDMNNIEDLERRAEEARRLAQQSQLETRNAKRSLLRSKARRVELQQQHYSRTCTVTRCSASHLELSLRGGVTASVIMSPPCSNLVRITVLPRSKTVSPSTSQFEQLGHDLLTLAWKGILSCLPEDQCQRGQHCLSSLEVTVPSEQVAGVIRGLDCTALRVDDQLSSLRSIRSCPELVDVSAKLVMGECAVLKISFDLVVSRSHKITAGPGGLAQVTATGEASQVEVTKCVIEMKTEPDAFPDSVDWTNTSVRQVCGHCRAAGAAQQALQELRGASIPEALSAAAQAIRQSWQ